MDSIALAIPVDGLLPVLGLVEAELAGAAVQNGLEFLYGIESFSVGQVAMGSLTGMFTFSVLALEQFPEHALKQFSRLSGTLY